MRISDWSPDVCSSDLSVRPRWFRAVAAIPGRCLKPSIGSRPMPTGLTFSGSGHGRLRGQARLIAPLRHRSEERRVGKECVSRVDLGGRRIIKNKNTRYNVYTNYCDKEYNNICK